MPLTRSQLESYLWGAAELLRGQIDASDYKQYIFPLLFFKRLSDVYDEEYQAALDASDGDTTFAEFAENHRFLIPAEAHWSEVREVTTNVGQSLQSAMREIERANPDELFGVFGDAQWTNKDRLPDRLLLSLIDHFSKYSLSIANVPQDELGDAYEYLIKKFADDSGHTAAEFYTNRTVVNFMTQIVDLQPGQEIYDPTCGSGGMLLNAVLDLKNRGGEHRGVNAYGQEINLITSAMARMNLFLHDIEEFDIRRGDTLADPKFTEGDRLRQFDVILANPPYSVSRWDREAFLHDRWGRNRYGVPPQSNADYAFLQHIIASLRPGAGRAAVLFPHGVLFRDYEQTMRRAILEDDLIEGVIGIGPNLFYNSSMEACVVVLNLSKPSDRKGQVLLIFDTTKTHRDRTVAVPAFLAEQLAAHIGDETTNSLLFTSKKGRPRRLSNWRSQVWRPAVKASKTSDALRPHDLRHFCASVLIQSGASPVMVARQLGHSSPRVTLDIYSHLFPTDLDTMADRLDIARRDAIATHARHEGQDGDS